MPPILLSMSRRNEFSLAPIIIKPTETKNWLGEPRCRPLNQSNFNPKKFGQGGLKRYDVFLFFSSSESSARMPSGFGRRAPTGVRRPLVSNLLNRGFGYENSIRRSSLLAVVYRF